MSPDDPEDRMTAETGEACRHNWVADANTPRDVFCTRCSLTFEDASPVQGSTPPSTGSGEREAAAERLARIADDLDSGYTLVSMGGRQIAAGLLASDLRLLLGGE